MIIQAGFDLQLLARLLIAPEGKVKPKLVVIVLDADMQLADLRVVSHQFDGLLEPHFEAILDQLDPDGTRFFAIAHAGAWPECPEANAPILEEAHALRILAHQHGFLMIGHFGLDRAESTSNGPYYYFDRYHLGLPCTMDHWVHSRQGQCE
ncbi:hypothetical protein [Pseudarthrobacter sp. DSP2-3-2b1]|uniref:hypothetical protein n=1 Tax=Pseudarthrobacter sp. DSP2-3-2b1 TaxID=2804661 RepID=UPI003CF28E94